MSGRWDSKRSSKTQFYSRMFLLGAAFVFVSTGLQLLVFFEAHHLAVAASYAVAEGTFGVMLIWASYFMKKLGQLEL